MRRALLLTCAAVVLGLMVVPAAGAHPSYLPWKDAMHNWYVCYSDDVLPESFSIAGVGVNLAPMPQTRRDLWDVKTRRLAQFITAVEGPYPSCRFSPRLREIVRPYLPCGEAGNLGD